MAEAHQCDFLKNLMDSDLNKKKKNTPKKTNQNHNQKSELPEQTMPVNFAVFSGGLWFIGSLPCTAGEGLGSQTSPCKALIVFARLFGHSASFPVELPGNRDGIISLELAEDMSISPETAFIERPGSKIP